VRRPPGRPPQHATYIGPNPAINSYVKSNGQSISIIAGAASGGAQLVVKPGINSAADLKGKTLASPQLGGTQDVALRAWLGKQGSKTSTDGTEHWRAKVRTRASAATSPNGDGARGPHCSVPDQSFVRDWPAAPDGRAFRGYLEWCPGLAGCVGGLGKGVGCG
jgi:hypothetical protein